ncbi:MAG: 3-hydroxyacyl-CoA dehydrogenase/enoyl-CoA hydratase family protein [Planctomycetota bacterium]
MAYAGGARTLNKVGIVGSGQIGPDIALHMTKVLHDSGASVVVVDIAEAALAAGRAKLEKKIDKGVEGGAFKPDEAAAMKAAVEFTSDYEQLRGADLVLEAASEDLDVKRKIFRRCEELCAEDAILASNSSHLEPEAIFAGVEEPGRTLVIHYFFPAERNPLVEVVPGRRTDDDVTAWVMEFYEEIGKAPIRVGSRYGYAIDPVFEGLFQAACLCVEEGLGSVREVDAVAQKSLGLGVGPFTAMNLTGGNPLTAHGLDQMTQKVNRWFKTPRIMRETMKGAQAWDGVKKGEKPEIPADREMRIAERMQGSYFGLVGEVLDSGITGVADFELGLELGLVMKPAFRFMNEVGPARALELVRAVQKAQKDFPVPRCLVKQAESGKPWEIPVVLRRDEAGIAFLTIRRPQVLNALNQEVYDQLERHVGAIGDDKGVHGVVITGFGRKAFVSGADVSMLAAVKSAAAGETTSRRSHEVLNRIEALGKPVICAYNGLALGGGNELALACHARVALKGLTVLAGQPEVNLGIIPGAGGTQRLPRVVGFQQAWTMLRTGKTVSSAEALKSGLIRAEVAEDVAGAAAALAREAAKGKVKLPRIRREPIDPPHDLPDVDLGHLSKSVDAVLKKAILEGARLGLDKGLQLECKCFGEVCGLQDMRIGMENFLKNGPRAKAAFVHR